ncbi:MAG TPA: SRPBCC family protein [Candidatus Sulfopaludibacter sp.]|jgi:uncharacterized protein YndB with AHSA1/START domain|nr:SRPBCC family protein [Candidatus Sulfopaludibacter sp.]
MIKAVINVDAPRQQVFSALAGFAQYAEWVPSCEQCEVLAVNGSLTDVRVVMNSAKRIDVGLRFEASPTQLLKFWMIKGTDIKRYAGTYRLMDAADQKGTVVIAELDVDAGFMAPRFLVDGMTSRALRDTGEALKKFVRTMSATETVAAQGTVDGDLAIRRKPLVRIVKTPLGYRTWLFGQYSTTETKGK